MRHSCSWAKNKWAKIQKQNKNKSSLDHTVSWQSLAYGVNCGTAEAIFLYRVKENEWISGWMNGMSLL